MGKNKAVIIAIPILPPGTHITPQTLDSTCKVRYLFLEEECFYFSVKGHLSKHMVYTKSVFYASSRLVPCHICQYMELCSREERHSNVDQYSGLLFEMGFFLQFKF